MQTAPGTRALCSPQATGQRMRLQCPAAAVTNGPKIHTAQICYAACHQQSECQQDCLLLQAPGSIHAFAFSASKGCL
jgi:hypothetical protein